MALPFSFPDPLGTTIADKERALYDWVRAATGLGAQQVYWAEQSGDRPEGTVIIMRLGLGPTAGVETLTIDDPGADLGEEVRQRVEATHEALVELTAFTPHVTVGQYTGRDLLTACAVALELPSVRAALRAGGLAPFDVGPVQNVTAINNAKFEGRALLEVRFYHLEAAEERCGYIETVEVEDFMGPPGLGTKDLIDI